MQYQDIVKAGLAAGLCLALTQCHDRSAKGTVDRVDLVAPPPPPAYAFRATIALTAKAAAHLKTHPESFTASARYYGLPTPATQGMADRDGVLALGAAQAQVKFSARPLTLNGVTYPETATLDFDGHGQSRDALKGIAGGKALVQLKVQSPRKAIACTGFQDYVETALMRDVTLVCDLD